MSERKIIVERGQWAMSSDPKTPNEIVWKETVIYGDSLTPEVRELSVESQGMRKEIVDHPILYCREIPSLEELDAKTVLFFKQLITVRINDFPENKYKYLVVGDNGKIYFKDLNYGSATMVDLNGSEDYQVTKKKAVRITKEEATELLVGKKTGYFFGKVETDAKGNVTSYGVVVRES